MLKRIPDSMSMIKHKVRNNILFIFIYPQY